MFNTEFQKSLDSGILKFKNFFPEDTVKAICYSAVGSFFLSSIVYKNTKCDRAIYAGCLAGSRALVYAVATPIFKKICKDDQAQFEIFTKCALSTLIPLCFHKNHTEINITYEFIGTLCTTLFHKLFIIKDEDPTNSVRMFLTI